MGDYLDSSSLGDHDTFFSNSKRERGNVFTRGSPTYVCMYVDRRFRRESDPSTRLLDST